jgi:hypothetical protein
MPVSLSATCPTCNGFISDDDRTCPRCGAAVSAFPAVERTPLILPGNPALSTDLFRKKISPIPIAAVALVAVTMLFAVLYANSSDEPRSLQGPIASDVEAAQRKAAIEAGMQQMARRDSASARNDAPSAAASALPPIPGTAEAAEIVAATPGASRPIPAAPNVTAPTGTTTAPPAIAASQTVAPSIASRTPTPAATPPATPTATPAAAAPGSVTPVLRLASLVSDSMRPGELLQLRWSIQDRMTGRAVPAAIEFTSTDANVAQVDRRTGIVSAKTPGRVSIIADAGTAGESTISLIVHASTAPAVVASALAEPLQMRSEGARSASTLGSAPAVRTSVVSAPPISPSREVSRVDLLDADDVRSAVDRFVSQVRSGSSKNAELMAFFADGAGHRTALLGAPATIGAGGNIVRVTFDVRLSKFDAGGRPITRIAPVSMDIEKRQSEVTSSAVAISTLRKP